MDFNIIDKNTKYMYLLAHHPDVDKAIDLLFEIGSEMNDKYKEGIFCSLNKGEKPKITWLLFD